MKLFMHKCVIRLHKKEFAVMLLKSNNFQAQLLKICSHRNTWSSDHLS